MSDHSSAVQKVLYATLTRAPAIAAGGFFDGVAPADVAFPHGEIGPQETVPDDASTENDAPDGDNGDEGLSDTFDLHLWSRYDGRAEIMRMVAEIHRRLHRKTLNVPERASAHSWVRSVRILLDDDGITRHGVVTVEIIHRS